MDFSAYFQPVLSQEDQPADGQKRQEREFTYYAKLADPSQLDGAERYEEQEQWGMRPPPEETRKYQGEARVRHCKPSDGEERYVLTVKTFAEGDDRKDEVELEVSADMFEQYKRLATGGMRKTRYYFPREDGTTWEVDVYLTNDGERCEWVKVDLEVPDERTEPRDFPIQLTEVIRGTIAERTEEERKQVAEILNTHFVLKNAYSK